MARKKLIRFQDNTDRTNIIEPGKPLFDTIKGHWNETYFHNEYPIILELGCGRGEYTTGLAPQLPYKNFIGIDVKGDRMWKGSVIAEAQGSKNVAFLRTQIAQLENFFAPQEVSEIWIPFPDPRPRDSDDRRRLVHPRFLNMYKNIMKPGGLVHFKTDNLKLFDYTLQVLKELPVTDLVFTNDLYHSDLITYHYGIKTRYEQKYVADGLKINYLHFKFA